MRNDNDVTTKEQIEIPFKKWKLVILFSSWLVMFPVLIFIGGILILSGGNMEGEIVIAMFMFMLAGFAGYLGFKTYKSLKQKVGLIINRQGIVTDLFGLVSWSDIEDIEESYISAGGGGYRALTLFVKNPQDYIEKSASSFLKRKMLQRSYEAYGSPIHIAPSELKMSFKDLHNLLVEKMKEYKP